MGYFFKVNEKLYEVDTGFQHLEVLDVQDFGRVLRLDNIFQTSERDEFLYHEPLAHVAGIAMNGPARALIIGGGDGGSAEELLKYSTIEKVVMIELDGEVVNACRKYIPAISAGAFDSKKMELRIEDGIKYIENCQEKFDQVIIDLTDPFGPSIALYSQEFYRAVANILTKRGAMSLHIESPISRPDLFSRIYWTLKSVFKEVVPMLNYVPMYGTLWGFALASQELKVADLTKEEINRRIQSLGLKKLQFYNSQTHHSLMALPSYVQKLLSEKREPISNKEKFETDVETDHGLVLASEESA